MADTTLTQGSNFYNPKTGKLEGTVQYDPQTGQKLAVGATTTLAGNLPQIDTAILQGNGTALQMPPNNQLMTPTVPMLNAPAPTLGLNYDPNSIEGKLEAAYNQTFTKGQEQLALEQQQGIPTLTKEIADLNTEIATKKAAFDQAQQNFTSGQVGTQELSTGKIAQVQRNEAVQLNGLSALLMAKQGQLDSAQALVDKTIQLEFEPIYEQIDALKQFYNMNPGLSSSEKKSLETTIADKEAATQNLEQAKKDAYQIGLQNLVPSSVITAITNAKTLDEVYAAIAGLDGADGVIGSTSNYKFTSTQSNKGAANAGMSLDSFKSLNPDIQNFYINDSDSEYLSLVDDIASGEATITDDNGDEIPMTPEQAIESIKKSSLSPAVKDYLIKQIQPSSNETESSGFTSTIIDPIKNFFGGLFN